MVVDLEWTSKEFFVPQKLHKACIIFCTSSDEIDGFAAGRTVFDAFAAVIEAALVLLGPDIIQLSYQSFVAFLFGFRHIDKE
jgi:hypothetical protein